MDNQQARWTEIEHLPEWDEEFYDVYTAKKFGKWVMLKTLKAEYRDRPDMQAMLEKEFDVRYNLAHPHIIMINDLEDVPGIGRCIITDDVYGDSLAKLLNEGRLTRTHVDKLGKQLVDALEYIQDNHLAHRPLRPENIIFTEKIGNLKLIDVGFDQHTSLSHGATREDISNWGLVVKEALDRSGIEHPTLRRVAERCIDPKRRYKNAATLRMALAGRNTNRLLVWVIVFLSAMVMLFVWMSLFPPKVINP